MGFSNPPWQNDASEPAGHLYPAGECASTKGHFALEAPPHVSSASVATHRGAHPLSSAAAKLAAHASTSQPVAASTASLRPHSEQSAGALASVEHRDVNAPEYSCTPTKPKVKNRNDTSTVTPNSSGIERRSVTTSLRVPSNPCNVRSGRNTRTTRIAEKFPRSSAASTPSMTTKKSILFQLSAR